MVGFDNVVRRFVPAPGAGAADQSSAGSFGHPQHPAAAPSGGAPRSSFDRSRRANSQEDEAITSTVPRPRQIRARNRGRTLPSMQGTRFWSTNKTLQRVQQVRGSLRPPLQVVKPLRGLTQLRPISYVCDHCCGGFRLCSLPRYR